MAPTTADYGIPSRPPTASTALWTHLMRPGAQTSAPQPDISHLAPPAKPLDKNAASMRILLHDAQAHFEKFTVHAGQLLDGVKETRHEIKSVQGLFERDRESLVGDIIDLVNRAQTEIQKAVGAPAQASALEAAFKDLNHRLVGLEQRLDSLQAINQSHTQMLQTQLQTTQMLLDKQGAILAAVAPLLPLLQAVPLHIDSLKPYIHENLPTRTSAIAGGRDRPHSSTRDGCLGNKRKRFDTAAYSTPAGAVLGGAPARQLKRLRTGSASPSPLAPQRIVAHHDRHQHLHHSNSRVSPLAASAGVVSPAVNANRVRQKSSTPGQQQQQRHATPRRPLIDLLLPLPGRQDTATTPRRLPQCTEMQDGTRRADHGSSAPMPRAVSIGASTRSPSSVSDPAPAPVAVSGPTPHARPPRILRMQTSLNLVNPSPQAMPDSMPIPTPMQNLMPVLNQSHNQVQFRALVLDPPGRVPMTIQVTGSVLGSRRCLSAAAIAAAARSDDDPESLHHAVSGQTREDPDKISQGSCARQPFFPPTANFGPRQVAERSIVAANGVNAEDGATGEAVAGPAQGSRSNRGTESVRGLVPPTDDLDQNRVSQASGARRQFFPSLMRVAGRSMTMAGATVVGPAQGSSLNQGTENVQAPVRTTAREDKNKVSHSSSVRQPFFPVGPAPNFGRQQRLASVTSSSLSSQVRAPPAAALTATNPKPIPARPNTGSTTTNAGAGHAQSNVQPKSNVPPSEVARLNRTVTAQVPVREAKPGRRFIPLDDSEDEPSDEAPFSLSEDFSSPV